MTEINKKITTSTGEKIYTELPSGSLEIIKNNLTPIFEKIDVLNSKEISDWEVSIFNKKVAKYAGDDGVLSDSEALKLAESFGFTMTEQMKAAGLTPVDIVKFIMNYTSSDALGENMTTAIYGEWYKFGFGEPDTEKFEELFLELDKNNAALVYHHYKGESLANDIQTFFNEETSKDMIHKIYNLMCARANEKNVPIETLKEKFTSAIKNNDKNLISDVLDEIASRLYTAETSTISAFSSGREHLKLQTKSKNKLVDLAFASGIEKPMSYDLAGDGILGDTESKPTKGSQLPNTEKIFNSVNKLLEYPVIREKLQSCVRKEGTYLVIRFPNPKVNNMYIEGENTIVNHTGRIVEDGVVGDGDMSLFVRAIYEQAKSDNRTDIFLDNKKLEQYILYLISTK